MNKGAQFDERKTPAHHIHEDKEKKVKEQLLTIKNIIKYIFTYTNRGLKWWVQRCEGVISLENKWSCISKTSQ
jgi:hypothetical protein